MCTSASREPDSSIAVSVDPLPARSGSDSTIERTDALASDSTSDSTLSRSAGTTTGDHAGAGDPSASGEAGPAATKGPWSTGSDSRRRSASTVVALTRSPAGPNPSATANSRGPA